MIRLEVPETMLPYEKPWILIDKVMEREPNRKIKAVKLVSFSDYFIRGHFPSNSIYPGVLLVEGIHQAVALLFASRLKTPELTFYNLQVRFLQPVYPGDAVVYEAEVCQLEGKTGVYAVVAKGSVDDKTVVRLKAVYQIESEAEKMETVQDVVLELLSDQGLGFVKKEEITLDHQLFALGFDSLKFAEFIVYLEDRIGREMPEEVLDISLEDTISAFLAKVEVEA